jgi:hypothetical protein
VRFRDQEIVFKHGSKGQNLDVPSANPLNYFDAVSNAAHLSGLSIDGKLLADAADSKLTDRDLMVYALKAGYGRKGAKIGSRAGESELFRADMLAFWQRTLG